MIEYCAFADTPDLTWAKWGNSPLTVWSSTGERLWTGLAAGWQETPQGGLVINRRAELSDDPELPAAMAFQVRQYAPGGWGYVDSEGYALDREAVLAQARAEQEQRREMERQIAEQRVAQSGVALPHRGVRRGG